MKESRQTPRAQFAPKSVADLVSTPPKRRATVVDGLLRAEDVVTLVGPSKRGKSWLVQALSLCAATGRPWLDRFDVSQTRVLHLDNELHEDTLARRFKSLGKVMGLAVDSYRVGLFASCVRGRPMPPEGAISEWCKASGIGLIVLDAMYKFAAEWGVKNENDNLEMTGFYQRLGNLASETGAAVVVVHHESKGNQSTRKRTDVGAGAGAIARCGDAHLILRQHEQDGVVVLEGDLRDWPELAPVALRRDDSGLWRVASGVDPKLLNGARGSRRETISPEARSTDALVAGFLSETPKDLAVVVEEAVAAGWSARAVTSAIRLGRATGRIHDHRRGNNAPSRLATVPLQESRS